MPRGADPQREKEYEELKDEFIQEHRYPGREEQVAARIVNKQRAEHGETKSSEEEDRKGISPDCSLPIVDYDKLNVDQIIGKFDKLEPAELREIKEYEQKHNNRKTLVENLSRRLG